VSIGASRRSLKGRRRCTGRTCSRRYLATFATSTRATSFLNRGSGISRRRSGWFEWHAPRDPPAAVHSRPSRRPARGSGPSRASVGPLRTGKRRQPVRYRRSRRRESNPHQVRSSGERSPLHDAWPVSRPTRAKSMLGRGRQPQSYSTTTCSPEPPPHPRARSACGSLGHSTPPQPHDNLLLTACSYLCWRW
jgi:hypothetical protein